MREGEPNSQVTTSQNTILSAPHPSPLNGKAFVNAVIKDQLFTHTNEILSAGGRGTVDWQLP